jgi:hypothetical protein
MFYAKENVIKMQTPLEVGEAQGTHKPPDAPGTHIVRLDLRIIVNIF